MESDLFSLKLKLPKKCKRYDADNHRYNPNGPLLSLAGLPDRARRKGTISTTWIDLGCHWLACLTEQVAREPFLQPAWTLVVSGWQI
ncbi:hypothetical protein RRG08_045581 [Elysia crispata]|uniref:Uncharacterized protein n=1 Tax=Elysia crispata TaxID=231223 RepID=A0AAE1AD11_9GAST|nr:hypothetical protein RRG08_045581 [Elysia crispata]